MEQITSLQNAKIKALKKLDKPAERKEQGLFLVEGLREVVLAKRGGYDIQQLFICPELLKPQPDYSLQELNGIEKIEVTESVYRSVAYRESTEGILATVKLKSHTLADLTLQPNSLILVIEAVEKPGNLGAMLRTADAAGVDAVIICDNKTDLYNANVIRSSVGTIFTNSVAVGSAEETISFLKINNVAILAATPEAETLYTKQNMTTAVAVVVGAEAEGLSSTWKNAATENVCIPMLGQIDSLNVSVSAALLLYEAVRQRRETNK
jgi:TrmH family RNA methyltransferase